MAIKILFIICIIINSNRVHSTSSGGWSEEEFSNTTGIIKQKHRMKRQLAFQPGTRIMVKEIKLKLRNDFKEIIG